MEKEIKKNNPKEIEEKKEHPIIRRIIIFFILITFVIYCYARYGIHELVKIEEYPLIKDSLPSNFNGFKITHFSDIHFGRTIKETQLKKIVKEINLTNADIVIFTGDLLDNSTNLSDKNIDDIKKSLSNIKAKQKKIAIKGDSDYLNIDVYEKIMKESGFEILENQNTLIFNNGPTPIQICGISSIAQEKYDLKKCFESKEPNIGLKVLLAHEPIMIEKLNGQKVDYIFSGHSLGGLIRLPYFGNIFKKENTEEYQKGFYQKEEIKMYVSSGLGTENYSFRTFNSPSINLYRFYNY